MQLTQSGVHGSSSGAGSGGSYIMISATKKVPQNSPTKYKGTNTLLVQPLIHLGQSLPNLNLNSSHVTNNTLLVPGVGAVSAHSNLLSPSHRGISYPPPSPTRYYRLYCIYVYVYIRQFPSQCIEYCCLPLLSPLSRLSVVLSCCSNHTRSAYLILTVCCFFMSFRVQNKSIWFVLCRATLRRGFAFSSSIKNPPLLKSRNIQSQNSFNASCAPQSMSANNIVNSGTSQQQQQQHQQQFQQQQQPFIPLPIGCTGSPQTSSQSTNEVMEFITFEKTQHCNESDVWWMPKLIVIIIAKTNNNEHLLFISSICEVEGERIAYHMIYTTYYYFTLWTNSIFFVLSFWQNQWKEGK